MIKIDWRQARNYLAVASDVIPKLPSLGDGPVTILVKALAIADSFDKHLRRGTDVFEFLRNMGTEPKNNAQFVDLLYSTPLLSTFKVEKIPIRDHMDIIIAKDDVLGSLYIIEYHWLGTPEPSNEFWHSKGFDFNGALDRLWDIYKQGIHISLKFELNRERPRTSYREMALPKDPIIGEAAERLETFIESHRQDRADGMPRTYLFLGMQGVGKSTFACRVAKAAGKRTLQINARGMTIAGANDLHFLLSALAPDFLILDDIDWVADTAIVPMLLEILSDLKARHPEVTAILTANSLKSFNPAVVRPGRIDDILEFDPPGPQERRVLLNGYLKEYQASCKNLTSFVKATEGLSAAYLKEVAFLLKRRSPQKVLETIKKMRRLSSETKSEDSGSPPGTDKAAKA